MASQELGEFLSSNRKSYRFAIKRSDVIVDSSLFIYSEIDHFFINHNNINGYSL